MGGSRVRPGKRVLPGPRRPRRGREGQEVGSRRRVLSEVEGIPGGVDEGRELLSCSGGLVLRPSACILGSRWDPAEECLVLALPCISEKTWRDDFFFFFTGGEKKKKKKKKK